MRGYDHWKTTNLADNELGPKPECEYCRNEPEPGYIETDNNGPIVPCPMCNRDGLRHHVTGTLYRIMPAREIG